MIVRFAIAPERLRTLPVTEPPLVTVWTSWCGDRTIPSGWRVPAGSVGLVGSRPWSMLAAIPPRVAATASRTRVEPHWVQNVAFSGTSAWQFWQVMANDPARRGEGIRCRDTSDHTALDPHSAQNFAWASSSWPHVLQALGLATRPVPQF